MASPSRLPSTRRPPGAAGGRARPVSMIEPGFSLPASDATNTTTRAMKRRSLLPQLSRASSAEYRLDEVTERENQDPDEAQVDGASDAAAEEARRVDRRAMPPPSKMSRPMSMRLPGSTGLARASSTRSHARTQSKESNTSSTGASTTSRDVPPVEAGLKRTSSTRLPQQPSKPTGLGRTASIRAPQPPVHARSGSTATVTTSTASKRSTINLSRQTPLNTTAAAAHQSSTAPLPTSPTKSLDLQPSGRSHMPPPSSRPAFNNYQQHFSPAKSALPKPPLPSSRQSKPAPVIEEDTTITFEIAKLQIELLQLSLLHQSSAQTLDQYTLSAHRKLGRKHAKLRKEFETVHAAEQEQQRLSNLEALQAWCPDPSLLLENLQTLGRIHREITSLTHPSSRYTDLLSTFEYWISCAELTLSGRSVDFITPLPNSWREAHASVALKVRSLQREMALLPPSPQRGDPAKSPASLEVLLVACRSLVDGVLKELDIVAKLEKELLGREKGRVDDALKRIAVDGKDEKWVPAWGKV